MGIGKKLPIGIENFGEIRTEGFYYVDKTGLIAELLNNWSKVNLFTRPRRFGKSLNMSMLKAFFEYGCDSRTFDGLHIAGERELCEAYMGRFPVISISLKDADATDYETAKRMLCSIIGSEAMRFSFLAESDRLSDFEKEQYRQLVRIGGKGEPGFIMEDEVITDARYDEHFGFSDKEVRKLLAFYGVEDRYETVKEWYDGYRFGNADVYCPWDVINYVDLLRSDPNAVPRAFWINTSSNDILKTFLRTAKQRTKREIEQLVDGQCIIKNINQELTYRDLYQNTDNLWSVLFTTGYLTHRGRPEGEKYRLSIPNLEIRKIFVDQILSWFQENVQKGNKENFYHGILLGLLSHCEEWDIDSNVESGDGFSDILVEIEEEKIGIVIKVKYSRESSLEADCRKALTQIREKNYERKLRQDRMTRIIRYGIACRKKECRVMLDA